MTELTKNGPAPPAAAEPKPRRSLLSGAAGRNLGLVIALLVLIGIGILTAGDRFASVNNMMTVLRLAAAIGVLAIGMTFVITTGGIDLSVGSVMGLTTVWATTAATQSIAQDIGWIGMVFTALVVGAAAGVVNGLLIAYGKVVAFIATLATMVAARGVAEIISNKRNQNVEVNSFKEFFQRGDFLGIPIQVWIFVVVSVLAWFLFNRTTFGRRTVAVGGNAEASRLAGIKVDRHLVYVYALCGMCAGIAGIIMLGRTGTGTSTHGFMYELDAIAAVVVGGTLLVGGRGTIVGTVFGVLIFTTLTNVFTMNDMDTSSQAVAKGILIVVAVLLQQRIANRTPRRSRPVAPAPPAPSATTSPPPT